MAGYFNIFHFLALLILIVIKVGFIILIRREQNNKILISLVATGVCVFILFAVMAMFVVDRYTKSAVLEKVTNERVLRSESIVFRGVVRNTGIASIANCDIVIKLINNPTNKDDLKGSTLFRPTGWSLFSWLNSEKKDDRPNAIEHKISIAKNLKTKEARNFYVSMPYPPYFAKTQIITKTNCY